MTTKPGAALRELLGPEAVEEPTGTAGSWSGSSHVAAVVSPNDPTAAAQAMAMACTEGWRVEPVGLGTWTDGTPSRELERPLVLVSSRRMTQILEYEPADLTLTVQAGATLQAIGEWVGGHGQWLPMDPPPNDRGTVGAMLATGSRGPLSHAFGGPRDLTLGMGLATGDGRLLNLGGRVVKNVAGFDLVRVTVGSWGTLGLITSATLRLFPRPEVDAVLTLHGAQDEMDGAARAVAGLPVEPAGIQVHTGAGGSTLCVRVMGSRDEVEDVSQRIRAAVVQRRWERLEGSPASVMLDMLRAMELGRRLAFRMSMLPSRIREARTLLSDFSSTVAGLDVGSPETIYEAGTGLLRVGVDTEGGCQDHATQCIAALAQLGDAVAALGGSLRLVHAPPAVRASHEPWPSGGSTTELVSGILGVFDPEGVLPGHRLVS